MISVMFLECMLTNYIPHRIGNTSVALHHFNAQIYRPIILELVSYM